MEQYKKEFIEFMVECGAITFGDFVTKSGRRTPFFINTGNFKTGAQLQRLGEFYAQAVYQHFGEEFEILFGPAYKGIPLSVATVIALNKLRSSKQIDPKQRQQKRNKGSWRRRNPDGRQAQRRRPGNHY